MAMTLSPTRARSYEECPWKFRETYVRKVPTLPNDLLDQGSLIHELLELMIQHLVQTKQTTAVHDISAIWDRFVAQREQAVPERMYAEAKRIVERFAGQFRLDLDRVWKAEAELAVNANGEACGWTDPDALVRGRGDLVLVDGPLGWVDDWKSGRVTKSSDALAEDLQARTYGMLLFRANPALQQVTVRFQYIRWGYTASTIFRKEDIEATWKRWLEISARIEAALARLDDEQLWAPTPGSHCTGCPVVTRCPLGMVTANEQFGLPTSAEQAEELAKRTLVLDAARKAINDNLKQWVEAAGPILAAGYSFDFQHDSSYDYDVYAIKGLADRHFIDPLRFLKVDSAALKRIGKKEKAFFLAAEALKTDKGRTSFRPKKVDEVEEEPDAS